MIKEANQKYQKTYREKQRALGYQLLSTWVHGTKRDEVLQFIKDKNQEAIDEIANKSSS